MAWIGVAFLAGQSPLETQHSRLILSYGAVDGATLQAQEWWRLIASQWLHSKPPHMLLNAVGVFCASACVEQRLGRPWLLCLYLIGGTAAQLASVLAYPALVSSGASQAMLVLCVPALVFPLLDRRLSALWLVVAAVVSIQIGLDLIVAHTIKAGHAAGLIIGAVATLGATLRERRLAPDP